MTRKDKQMPSNPAFMHFLGEKSLCQTFDKENISKERPLVTDWLTAFGHVGNSDNLEGILLFVLTWTQWSFIWFKMKKIICQREQTVNYKLA